MKKKYDVKTAFRSIHRIDDDDMRVKYMKTYFPRDIDLKKLVIAIMDDGLLPAIREFCLQKYAAVFKMNWSLYESEEWMTLEFDNTSIQDDIEGIEECRDNWGGQGVCSERDLQSSTVDKNRYNTVITTHFTYAHGDNPGIERYRSFRTVMTLVEDLCRAADPGISNRVARKVVTLLYKAGIRIRK